MSINPFYFLHRSQLHIANIREVNLWAESSMVTICYESILRCGNRLELGYIHALETSPWNSGVLRLYVNMGYFSNMARWLT